jgi:hypothetical protein
MMKSLRQPSQFPRIDTPSDFGGLRSPRFGRLDPPASGSLQHVLSNIAKRAYPAILVPAVFLCFFLATAAIRLATWSAAFRH